MKILITNDDSITGKGLEILTKWAMKFADVTVVCPKYEQSGKSHAIEIHKPIEVKKVNYIDGVEAYTVDSAPADCVRFATLGLKKEFDLVFSGINNGLNLGSDIIYSGTVAGVVEAKRHNMKGIAFSTEPGGFVESAAKLDEIYAFFQKHDLLSKADIYNVNIPRAPKEIRITREGGAYYEDFYTAAGEDLYMPNGYCCYKEGRNFDLDTDATLVGGYISITPLILEQTNDTAFEELKKLNGS